MKRKSQIEVQFNWVFVLVVGAIILVFFSSIILKYKDASEKSSNVYISRNLEAIFSGAEASKDTINLLEDIPKKEIKFSCGGFDVGGTFKKVNNMLLFSPSVVKSSRLLTWTLDWSAPYRATNFVYLIDPNVHYVLIGENDFSKKIYEEMHSHEFFYKTLSSTDNIKGSGHKKARLVYFNGEPSDVPLSLVKLKDRDVSALRVFENSRKIEFYEKKGKKFQMTGESYYLYDSSLIGAIITDDVSLYNCVMQNAFNKLNVVSRIYYKKTQELMNYYNSENPSCAEYHSTENINMILSASREFKPANIENIHSAALNLDNQNRGAERNSCAMIY